MKDNLKNHKLLPATMTASIALFMFSLTACDSNPTVSQNIAASGGKNSVAVRSSPIPAGDATCINGGILVDTGIDENSNGILDTNEIDTSEKLCHGNSGLAGQSGLNSLIALSQEPSGTNCPNGGVKIESGLDANSNNTLDINEISDAEFLCNSTSNNTDNNNTTTGNFDQATYDALTNDDTVNGGLLYDQWWKASTNATEPAAGNNHPLWPVTNTAIQDSGTWRCMECHGWDYRGRDGVYSSGTHFTGLPGIVTTATANMSRTTPETLYTFLTTDSTHGFANSFFTDAEYYDLVKFVMTIRSEAASNTASYNFISENKQAIGANTIEGKALFEGTASCSICHGTNGKQIDFIDKNLNTTPNEFVHDIAQDNPWEFVHKVRFGQPGGAMTGLFNQAGTNALMQATINLLGYAQTSLAPEIKRAGLLYDKWWATNNALQTIAPTTRNPIWVENLNASQDPAVVSNENTWRCSSCHGWDYQGVNGALADTSDPYYTGIVGFTAAKSKPAATLIDAIANGNCTACDPTGHSFSQVLSAEDISLLAEFIQSLPTQETYSAALNSTNITNGQTLFKSSTPGHCESCHGVDGKTIPIADVSAKAINNPQEFLHKVRFGQPGTFMLPPTLGFMGLSLSDAGDVLAYSKTIGTANNASPSYSNASVQRGGRLYDKWWVEMQSTDVTVQKPSGINPFFTAGQNTGNLPALPSGQEDQSWRCKSCHAWDYQGVGYYTGASASNGADNLLYKINLRRTETFINDEPGLQQHFFTWIKTGYGSNHNLGEVTANNTTPLKDQDIWDIVKFLLEGGIVNSESHILASGVAINPNLTNGEGLYNGSVNPDINCSICHGVDGNTPPPEVQGGSGQPLDIFALAAATDNPWEFAHKVRFGQPGTSMPGTTGIPSLTDQDAYDILGYAQKRFNERP